MHTLTVLDPEESRPAIERPLDVDECNLPIFSQGWWLEVARRTSSNYRELKVAPDGVTLGRLPFVLTRNRLGLALAQNPHWSHLGGPIIDENLSRYEQAEVIDLLLEQLPRWTSFYFVCDPHSNYADLVKTAFTRKGFEHSAQSNLVRYPSDADVLSERKRKHRLHIRRAAKELDCVEIGGREFVDFFEANLKAKGKRSYSPVETLWTLIDEAIARGRACAIAARPFHVGPDGSSGYDAAIVYAWDNARCYYWLSTNRPLPADNSSPPPHPDAIKLLAVRAMEDAQTRGLIFDADGVTTPGTHNLYRNMFGLREEPSRNVFRHTTTLQGFYENWRRQFGTLIDR